MTNHIFNDDPTVATADGQSLVLNAESFDLWGSRLIEASAGTGKTWTIAALYLRLVLGHGAEHGFGRALRPSEILVMTFVGLPVVNCPYMPAAEMPMPCCPRLMRKRWNFEP